MQRKSQWVSAAIAMAGALLLAQGAQAHENHGWAVGAGSVVQGVVVQAPRYVTPAARHARAGHWTRAGDVRHGGYGQPTRWDRDGDGIPNRHDRLYNPRWDVDGDGRPNRRDPYDNRVGDGRGPHHGHGHRGGR